MTGARFIIFTIITLLVQIFIAEFINLHQMVYIVITPLPVLFLPYNYSKSLTMVFAFIIGLLTDLSYDGVMGLNAAALVAVAFFKEPVLKLIVSKATRENLSEINSATAGKRAFALVSLALCSVFFLFYIALDNVLYFSFAYTSARFIINVLLNTFIIMLVEFTLFRGFLEKR